MFLQLLGVYSVSKTALLGLSKAAAKDLAPENIRVNCVAPGIVNTKFSAAVSTSHCSLVATCLVAVDEVVMTLPQLIWARLQNALLRWGTTQDRFLPLQ